MKPSRIILTLLVLVIFSAFIGESHPLSPVIFAVLLCGWGACWILEKE